MIHRFPPLLYTDEGKGVMQRLWEETLDELQFADAGGIIKSMQK